jgi:hypothetical protein
MYFGTKHLWLLLMFIGVWAGAYIFSQMGLHGHQWYTVPAAVAVFVVWLQLLVVALDNISLK